VKSFGFIAFGHRSGTTFQALVLFILFFFKNNFIATYVGIFALQEKYLIRQEQGFLPSEVNRKSKRI
jgi:hypothetical protein